MGDTTSRHLVLLGTGTSVGVPMIGCHCDVCDSDEPKNQRGRCGVAGEAADGVFLLDTPPEPRLQPGEVVRADNHHTFRKALRPYVEHMQSGENGFESATLSISDGLEYSYYAG